MTSRTAEIAARRSAGSDARYSSTVLALDCMPRGSGRRPPVSSAAISSTGEGRDTPEDLDDAHVGGQIALVSAQDQEVPGAPGGRTANARAAARHFATGSN